MPLDDERAGRGHDGAGGGLSAHLVPPPGVVPHPHHAVVVPRVPAREGRRQRGAAHVAPTSGHVAATSGRRQLQRTVREAAAPVWVLRSKRRLRRQSEQRASVCVNECVMRM